MIEHTEAVPAIPETWQLLHGGREIARAESGTDGPIVRFVAGELSGPDGNNWRWRDVVEFRGWYQCHPRPTPVAFPLRLIESTE